MNNIHVIIGDNGIGKTRFLVKKADECRKNNLRLVTNLEQYMVYNSDNLDRNKINAIDDLGNELLNRFKVDGLRIRLKSFKLLGLVMLEGDVLILDEVDALIPGQDILGLMTAIANCREYWKEIYISGYCAYVDRVFIDTNRDDYSKTYNPNYYTIKENKLKSMTEDEIYKYLNQV